MRSDSDLIISLELALLTNQPRAATIIAKGKLRCVCLGKQAFDRLLGPAHEMIRRNIGAYKNMARHKSIQGALCPQCSRCAIPTHL